MHVVKRIVHILATSVLSVVVVMGTIGLAVLINLTDRTTVKQWPIDANIYSEITEVMLDGISAGEGADAERLDTVLANSALDPNSIKDSIRSTFTAAFWQQQIESVLDANYNWLEGNAPLGFSLTLSSLKDDFANNFEKTLREQLETLPACSTSQITPVFDPFRAECIPPGITAESAAREITQQITEQDTLFASSFTEQSMVSVEGGDAKPIVELLPKNLPDYYQLARGAVIVMPLLMLVLVIVTIVTDQSIIFGLRKAGRSLFIVGVLSWASYYVTLQLNKDFSIPNLGLEDKMQVSANEKVFTPLIREILEDITTSALWIALAVTVFGGLLWLAGYIYHKTSHHREAEEIARRAMANRQSLPDPTLPPPIEPDQTGQNNPPPPENPPTI